MIIKILQWNVFYKEKIKNIAELLAQLNPDIICLQELTVNSENNNYRNVPKEIADVIGYHHFYRPSMKFRNKKGWEFLGNGIYSRFPIINSKMKYIQKPSGINDYDKQGRVYLEIKIRIGKKLLTIGTAHASYSHKFDITPQKTKEIDKLVNILKKNRRNFIFTGDMNSTPNSYTIKQIEKYMKNCGPVYSQKTWTTKPFDYNGFKETKLVWRLDYVFASKDMKVIKSRIIKTKFSDHLPVLTYIDIPV